MAEFPVKDGETFLFIGDSITDCGRRDAAKPLGEGYVAYFVDIATSYCPERAIRWINKGIGGNTIGNLKERWTDDALWHEPDWLSVKIGINDLHCTMDNPKLFPPDVFAEIYDGLLSRVGGGTRLVLIDPFYLSTDRSKDTHRGKVLELLPGYLEVVKRMSEKYKALHVETHAMFQRQLEHRDPDYFCGEPVHPYRQGHMMIAHEFWRVMCAGL